MQFNVNPELASCYHALLASDGQSKSVLPFLPPEISMATVSIDRLRSDAKCQPNSLKDYLASDVCAAPNDTNGKRACCSVAAYGRLFEATL